MHGLFLLGFFAIFSTTISKNPVLPLFSQALGAGDAVIGLIAAVSPLAGVSGDPSEAPLHRKAHLPSRQ